MPINRASIKGPVRVFTDASWEKGVAGFGVYFEAHSQHSFCGSEKLGPALTSNTAEFMAVQVAVKRLLGLHLPDVHLYTDNSSVSKAFAGTVKVRQSYTLAVFESTRTSLRQLSCRGTSVKILHTSRSGCLGIKIADKLALRGRLQHKSGQSSEGPNNKPIKEYIHELEVIYKTKPDLPVSELNK